MTPGEVKLYVCGMTVYDYCHLGHARVLVVFDSVVRWLQTLGFKVIYVRNITDIDDKIIQRALINGESIKTLTDRYIQAMQEDAAALGVMPPSHEPRATECIDTMIAMISALLAKNLAYTADNNDVYYAVHNFPHYGKLSGKSLEDLRAGERVEIDGNKRDPLDFVLWKAAKPDEPYWDSPWGKGRPGWHIECSAMSEHYLGAQFDIHGGGQDLQFPHHENEIAQSEGMHGHQHVNYWMHNGFVRVDNEKMSKSLGNFFTVREVLTRYQPEVVRFFILRAHYRSPLNYSDAHLDDAKNALERLYTVLRNHDGTTIAIDWEQDPYALRFMTAMNDDFNTPEAIAVLFDLASEANRTGDTRYAALLKSLAGVLGLMQQSPQSFFQYLTDSQTNELTEVLIEQLIQQRLQARQEKDFAKADSLRQQLSENGIILEDGSQGTVWRRA
ncbi:cysteinyl-tRNA synthetase [Nitrosomonas mobilis]|uniref:Cysteine--tRNA ligase n=2 Tax=Nitrosomonas mobilis TaxID=51642 RepID=A0A1G5SI72_9PROT|nr:cysteinyl-tRNA synthetase [Nitrosomonas mobilis]